MAHGARETRYTPYQGKISPKNVYDSMHANTFNTLTQHAETPIRRSTQLTSLGETRPALLAASSLALASESAPMFAPQCGCTFPYTFPSANSSGCCLHMQSILCAPRIRSPHSFQIRSPHTRGCQGMPHRWRTRGTGASCIDFSWNSPHACLSPHSERVPSACMHSERVPSAGATRALPSSAAPPLPVEQVEQVEHLLLADDIRTCYAVRSFYAASGRHCSGV